MVSELDKGCGPDDARMKRLFQLSWKVLAKALDSYTYTAEAEDQPDGKRPGGLLAPPVMVEYRGAEAVQKYWKYLDQAAMATQMQEFGNNLNVLKPCRAFARCLGGPQCTKVQEWIRMMSANVQGSQGVGVVRTLKALEDTSQNKAGSIVPVALSKGGASSSTAVDAALPGHNASAKASEAAKRKDDLAQFLKKNKPMSA